MERASRVLALAVIAVVVLIANYDPVVTQLPDLPKGGALPLTETAKQGFVLAAGLTVMTFVVALWAVARGLRGIETSVGASAGLRVLVPSALVAVVVFLWLFSQESDDRGLFAAGTALVLLAGALGSVETLPALPAISLSKLPVVTTVAAILLIVGYAAMLQFMTGKVATKDSLEWERLVTLFAGVESIGFAAVGALLGQQIQKVQSDAAGARADSVQQEAADIGGALKGRLAAPSGEGDAPMAADPDLHVLADRLIRLGSRTKT